MCCTRMHVHTRAHRRTCCTRTHKQMHTTHVLCVPAHTYTQAHVHTCTKCTQSMYAHMETYMDKGACGVHTWISVCTSYDLMCICVCMCRMCACVHKWAPRGNSPTGAWTHPACFSSEAFSPWACLLLVSKRVNTAGHFEAICHRPVGRSQHFRACVVGMRETPCMAPT